MSGAKPSCGCRRSCASRCCCTVRANPKLSAVQLHVTAAPATALRRGWLDQASLTRADWSRVGAAAQRGAEVRVL